MTDLSEPATAVPVEDDGGPHDGVERPPVPHLDTPRLDLEPLRAGHAVGTLQATVHTGANGPAADVAWVVATAYQGRGYAGEAARALVGWLREQGVDDVRAYVHPGNEASQRVARAAGLAPTTLMIDGEVRWQSARPGSA